jgi:hypothetical protein
MNPSSPENEDGPPLQALPFLMGPSLLPFATTDGRGDSMNEMEMTMKIYISGNRDHNSSTLSPTRP